jgi:hypothetical protein
MIGTHKYNTNIMKMCVKVESMEPYNNVEFTFDSLMKQLLKEGPQEVRGNNYYASALIAGEHPVSDMVEIAKKHYGEEGNKVFIKLRHKSGLNWQIDFQNKNTDPAGAASARLPFRSRRRGSKSVQRRRKLGSKSKSRKRSSKPRRR